MVDHESYKAGMFDAENRLRPELERLRKASEWAMRDGDEKFGWVLELKGENRRLRDKLIAIENVALQNDGDREPGTAWAAVFRLCREALESDSTKEQE